MDLAAAEAANEYRIEDIPVVLRRKPPAKVWTARISLGVDGGDRGRIERSTGERDLKRAISAARRLHGELAYRAERGETFRGMAFDQAVRTYLTAFGQDVAAGAQPKWKLERVRVSLERYYAPYFKGRRIDAISHDDLVEHSRWRLTRHETAPTSIVTYERDGKMMSRPHAEVAPGVETLRKERQHFMWLMEYAVKRQWLKADAVPAYDKLKGRGETRGAFDPNEMRLLQEVSISRVRKKKHRPTKRQWVLNHFRCLFIYLTGCRPQELTRLRFRHLKVGTDVTGKDSYVVDLPLECLKDKEKHKRRVVPLPGFKLLIDTMVHFYKEVDGVNVTDEDFLFRSKRGGIVKKTAKCFKGLLRAMERAAELPEVEADNDNLADEVDDDTDDSEDDDEDGDGRDRTLYSFRHTFATERLYEGIDIGKLSRWMGTSVEMIELHYGHTVSHVEMTGTLKPWSHVLVDFRLSGFGYEVDERQEPARIEEFREMVKASMPPTDIPNAYDGVLTMPKKTSWGRVC